MRRRWFVAGAVGSAVVALYGANASWLAPAPTGRPGVLAHRGVHQTFRHDGLDVNGCTATRINPPTNPYLENTIASMKAGFAAGATALELDVHPTSDGEFAVFHDWALDCRTNGKGVTRERSMAYLRALDIGYGYTSDGGKSFPFRGQGVGLMPTLREVLSTFPGRRFLINIKSDDPHEADQLFDYLTRYDLPTDRRLWVYAADRPFRRLRTRAPQALLMSKRTGKMCALGYLALGWSGFVPGACRDGVIGVPVNLRRLYWGWPNRFLARMRDAKVEVLLIGSVGRQAAYADGTSGAGGVTDVADLAAVPDGFPGLILTDDVERIGPAVRERWPDR